MKILHITNHAYPCVGGIENHVLDLCFELRKKKIRADILCLNTCANSKNPLPSQEKYKDTTIYRVPYTDLKYYKIARKIPSILDDYDILHVHGTGYFLDYFASTKFKHKKTMIFSTHGGFFHTKSLGSLKKIHFKTLTKSLLKKVDKIVAVSKQDHVLFSSLTQNITFIPNGITLTKKIGRKKPLTFLYLGRIAKNKRLDNLIETFSYVIAKNKKVHLAIVGRDHDNLLPSLKKQVRELGIEKNISFVGEVTGKEKSAYLNESEFFVAASEYEGFGIAVIEAMNAGCIPILNSVPAFQNLVTHKKTGYLIDYTSHKKAAQAILSFTAMKSLSDPVQREARQYSWSQIIKKWISLYEEVGGKI